MRLLARVYADGNTPSKVSVPTLSLQNEISVDDMAVVAKLHEAQVHGQITVVACSRYHFAARHLLKQSHLSVPLIQSIILICAKLTSSRVKHGVGIAFFEPSRLGMRPEIITRTCR